MGCGLGALAVFIPALLCGVLARLLVAGAHGLLAGWQSVRLGLFTVDLVETLHLGGPLAAVQALDAAGWWLALAVALAFVAGGGLALAPIAAALGLGYNSLARLAGGLEIELEPIGSEEGHGPRG